MNKIEKIEELLEKWEADKFRADKKGNYSMAEAIHYKIIGLRSAMKIIKEPSNTQIHIDVCKCPQGSLCEFFNGSEQCYYGKI